jgi:hypothetical protein
LLCPGWAPGIPKNTLDLVENTNTLAYISREKGFVTLAFKTFELLKTYFAKVTGFLLK